MRAGDFENVGAVFAEDAGDYRAGDDAAEFEDFDSCEGFDGRGGVVGWEGDFWG